MKYEAYYKIIACQKFNYSSFSTFVCRLVVWWFSRFNVFTRLRHYEITSLRNYVMTKPPNAQTTTIEQVLT